MATSGSSTNQITINAAPGMDPQAVARAYEQLPAHQPMSRVNRTVHAAAWCSVDGEILLSREDVGRHNALDKLIGLIDTLAAEGIEVHHLDLGGGLGILQVVLGRLVGHGAVDHVAHLLLHAACRHPMFDVVGQLPGAPALGDGLPLVLRRGGAAWAG